MMLLLGLPAAAVADAVDCSDAYGRLMHRKSSLRQQTLGQPGSAVMLMESVEGRKPVFRTV